MEDEEALMWRRRPDPRAVEFLLKQYDRLIGASIKRVAGASRGDTNDLEQEARIGLLKAITGFDPFRDKDFASYAVPWIRGAIEEYLRSPAASWVKRSGQEKKKRVDMARATLEARGISNPTEEDFAAELGLSEADTLALLQGANLPTLAPLEAGLDEDTPSPSDTVIGDTGDLTSQLWAAENEAILERAIQRLKPASKKAVFRGRAERGMSAREVAERLGISPKEVNNIYAETQALLRSFLNRAKGRLTEKSPELFDSKKSRRGRGRPSGKQAEERFIFGVDRTRRERRIQLAQRMGVSEAEVCRRGIDCLWEREGEG